MKPIKSLLVLAVLAAPGIASAQGYYGGGGGGAPLPGGFHNRMGRVMYGVSIGLGGMHDDGSGITDCGNCDYNPLAAEADMHLGGMISPRFGLMAEAQFNGQTVQTDPFSDNGDTVLIQSTLMIAGQYWLTPQLWVKGGLGLAHLDAQDNYYDYDFGGGAAIMGGIGFELLSARFMSVDLQGRIIEGSYHGLDDHITSATVGVGLNWY